MRKSALQPIVAGSPLHRSQVHHSCGPELPASVCSTWDHASRYWEVLETFLGAPCAPQCCTPADFGERVACSRSDSLIRRTKS